jgi:hypothetical protein
MVGSFGWLALLARSDTNAGQLQRAGRVSPSA